MKKRMINPKLQLQDSIVITGIGAYCSIGRSVTELSDSLLSGADGIRQINRFSTEEFEAHYAALIPEKNVGELERQFPDVDLRTAMAIVSAKEAWLDAEMNYYPAERVALVVGMCIKKMYEASEGETIPELEKKKLNSQIAQNRFQFQAQTIAKHIGIKGPVIVISTACASSSHALGFARDILSNGFVDAVLVGGTGDVAPEMFAGFYCLNNMSPSPCAPFSVPAGLNLGEGAGFLVLEKSSLKNDCSGHIKGFLMGFGSAGDAYHSTTPDSAGAGVARAISSAIADAGVKPSDIGYINVHGTGTVENDKGEWLGIRKVLGDTARNIPVSSSKSFIGHTGAGAGILESIITILCMDRQLVPPTLHFKQPRRLAPDDPVACSKPKPWNYDYAINCNSAFGGMNTAVVLGKQSSTQCVNPMNCSKVKILGTGSISAAGTNNLNTTYAENKQIFSKTPERKWETSVPDYAAYVPPFDYAPFTKGKDERFLDPISRFMAAACGLALSDAQLTIDDEIGIKIGIVTGVSNVPGKSVKEFQKSIRERGFSGSSSHAFSRIVMNASLGAVSEIYSLKGPSCTIAAEDGAGLFAAAYACMKIRQSDEAGVMLGIAADELGDVALYSHALGESRYTPAEGAGCVVFAREDFPNTRSIGYVEGIGIAGADQLSVAIESALGDDDLNKIDGIFCSHNGSAATVELQEDGLRKIWGESLSTVTIFNPAPYLGYAEAGTSMFALISAIESLKTGILPGVNKSKKDVDKEIEKLLVVSVSEKNGSCAICIEKDNG